jgi:O-antigen/teichoic acid export membrane protein
MKGLAKTATYLVIADAASKGASGVLALLIARYLGPVVYGGYATAASLCGVFLLISAIGFEQELTRRGGMDERELGPALVLNLFCVAATGLLAYGAMMLFVQFAGYSREVVLLTAWLGVATLAVRFNLPFRYVSLVLQQTGVAALLQGTTTVIMLGASLAVMFAGGTVFGLVGVQLVAGVAAFLAWMLWWPRERWTATALSRESVVTFLKASLAFGASNVIWVAYFNFDVFMLSLLRPGAEVGLYAGVYRIVAVSYVVGYAVTNAFTPQLFRTFGTSAQDFRRLALRVWQVTIGLGVVSGLTLIGGAGILVTGILGPEYAAAIPLARILGVAAVLRMVNLGLCETMTTSDRQILRVVFEGGMLAINVAVNAALIPRYGATGAAVATLAAEVALTLAAVVVFMAQGVVPVRAPAASQ